MKFLDTAKDGAAETINSIGVWLRKDQGPYGNGYWEIILVLVINLVALACGIAMGFMLGVSWR